MNTINWKDKKFNQETMLRKHSEGRDWYYFNPFESGFVNDSKTTDAAIPLQKFHFDYLASADLNTIKRITVY